MIDTLRKINSLALYSLDDAVQLNNQAVRQSIEGQDKQAIILFSQSLAVLEALVVSRRNLNDKVVSIPTLHAEKPRLPMMNRKDSSLFDQLLTFARYCEDDCTTTDFCVYCAGVLFNMALVFHHQAITRNNGSLLDKAEQLYQRIIPIIPSAQRRGTSAGVRLAAQHNLRQIHKRRQESRSQLRILEEEVERFAVAPPHHNGDQDMSDVLPIMECLNRHDVDPRRRISAAAA